MADYPKDVLTESKKGKIELRRLLERGRYVLYDYRDPESGERTENKEKLVLIREGTGAEDAREFFIIHTAAARDLLVKAAPRGERKVWDGEKAVDL